MRLKKARSRTSVQGTMEAAGAMKMWKTPKTGFPHFHRALENSPPQKTRQRVSHSFHSARLGFRFGKVLKTKNLRGE